ncbi:hypothetical protein ACFQ3J_13840 [Paenibacillus provencensis]|uniref:Uncharacterized protein n=1 Tax=Paenibacillus provencensis TaxID=441151 RepID=A0ABW3PVN0_9BACL|nr:hypothetical protein [Paenibacillus sp. MER 78]MCM3127715.1 hypothetical protein [Paenibacillus sp. MER 78]
MIRLKPLISETIKCPRCQSSLPGTILWQGIHVCLESKCEHCESLITVDLPVGHATYFPFTVSIPDNGIYGEPKAVNWLGRPLLDSLNNPNDDPAITLKVGSRQLHDKVIIVNCIDYLYGHALLKLLNVQREYEQNQGYSIIVIVQKALRWLVPEEYVSEVWEVNLPFKNARSYYPQLNEQINAELNRCKEVYLSHAYSHPSSFDISKFTQINKFDSSNVQNKRITFIWREDRFWIKFYNLSRLVQKYPKLKKFTSPLVTYQKMKVIHLFKQLKKQFPQYEYTIAGLGENGSFPEWIDDMRVNSFDIESERLTCKVYSESEVVIGVHGSNMLLPSAHAGMSVVLMPQDRWGNYAQDILFQQSDSRISAYNYRFLPIELSMRTMLKIIAKQIQGKSHYYLQMLEDKNEDNNEDNKKNQLKMSNSTLQKQA